MPSCTQDKLFKILEWVLVIGLFFASFWFMTDVWEKFRSKKTSFTVYKEDRKEMPTTVVCFEPYGKPSVMAKYGISVQDLVFATFPEDLSGKSWKDFRDEMQYVLGKDFYFTYYDKDYNPYTFDTEGLYDIGDVKGLIEVENMQTVWSGLCVRITFKKHVPGSTLGMYIDFKNETLKVFDVPNPVLYVTSEDNAYGIIGFGWPNGEEVKFNFDGYEQDFKIYAFKKKFLNVTDTCSQYLQDDCGSNMIANYNYSDCENPCMAVTLPKATKKDLAFKDDECETVGDRVCMMWKFNEALLEVLENCPKNCENVQYDGKSTFLLKTDENHTYSRKWNYAFANKKIEVEEEFIIVDETILIGTVGGTLGLFIGFSFRDITGLLIEGLKWFLKRKRVSSTSSSINK